MKTTLEIPDTVFRKAKAISMRNGQTFGSYVTLAVESRVAEDMRRGNAKPWMRHAGAFKSSPAELAKIRSAIAAEFEQIEDES
ncbi:hypothetical protein M2103_000266 [Ereboglobus sp. PH5-5]|uniref:hypothetical protein n=1 Tax=unclassified Ereboglobus TaxID=2626932 RepID=UPI00240740D7|nr:MULTISPECIES: hypothetical protein [unclassified Ereboglobus]MDF9826046.1 hypothetical protein [Ereboglobus sp. PH5-10]MDF9832058.1 hypothetical protein [Ereboglobus sp. PH5-5]